MSLVGTYPNYILDPVIIQQIRRPISQIDPNRIYERGRSIYAEDDFDHSRVVSHKCGDNTTPYYRLTELLNSTDHIISGLGLSISTDHTHVIIQPGVWLIDGITYNLASVVALAIDARDTSQNRYDVLYVDTNSTVNVISGDLSTTPIEPSIPEDTLKIGSVLITPTSDDITIPAPITGYVDTSTDQMAEGRKTWYDTATLQNGAVFNNRITTPNSPTIIVNSSSNGDAAVFNGSVISNLGLPSLNKSFDIYNNSGIDPNVDPNNILQASFNSNGIILDIKNNRFEIGFESTITLGQNGVSIQGGDNSGSYVSTTFTSNGIHIIDGSKIGSGYGGDYSVATEDNPDAQGVAFFGDRWIPDVGYVNVLIAAATTGSAVTSISIASTNGFIGSSSGGTTPVLTLQLQDATTSQSGQLTNTDWNIFNNKQNVLSGTGFVKSVGGTISYDTNTYLTTASASSTYLPLGGGTLTGALVLAADPTLALHPATKNYVDNLITGITWKQEVRAGTTANIILSGTQTVDAVVLIVGDRVLVKNQTTQKDNGIYLVASGAWTRTVDADSGSEIGSATVLVRNGTVNKDTQWTCTNSTDPVIGTDAITFGQISGAGTYTNGTGISLSSNIFSFDTTFGDGRYVQSANLLNLSATDNTLTFSGNYNTTIARTIGINLGNPNIWTANQIISTASGSQLTLTNTTSSTFSQAIGGNLTITPGSSLIVSGALTVTSNFVSSSVSSNLMVPSGTGVGHSTQTQFQWGGSTANSLRVAFYGSTSSSLTVNDNYSAVLFASAPITLTSGTSDLATAVFKPVTITSQGSATIPVNATVWIDGAGSGGTLNPALYIASGNFNYQTATASTLAKFDANKNLVSATAATTQDVTNAFNIAWWGDSLTMGGNAYVVSIPNLVQQSTGYNYYNGGVGGITSTQIKTNMLAATDKYTWTTVIWAGQNNHNSGSTVQSDIAAMVAALGHTRYLVLSVLHDSSFVSGSSDYINITTLNSALATTYGARFLDVDATMRAASDGSAADIADTANGVVVTSCRATYNGSTDHLHLSLKGNNIVASAIVSASSNILYTELPITTRSIQGVSADKLSMDVADGGSYKIGSNMAIYMPSQTTYTGTIFIGTGVSAGNWNANGPLNLTHSGTNDGQFNFFGGIFVGSSITTGYRNVLITPNVSALTSAHDNTGLGYFALVDLTTGQFNVAIGDKVGGGITTGQYNTLIGGNINGLSSSLSNTVIIGDGNGNQIINVATSNTALAQNLFLATPNGSTGAGTFRAINAADINSIVPTWSNKHIWNLGTLNTTSLVGISLQNTTLAAVGAQQFSPYLEWIAQGWKTNATAGSEAVQAQMGLQAIQGTSAPTGSFILGFLVNGVATPGAYSYTTAGVTIFSGGNFTNKIFNTTTTDVDGIINLCNTAALVGTQVQNTPAFTLQGNVWNQSGTPATNVFGWRMLARGTSSTTPSSDFIWASGIGVGTSTYTDRMKLNSGGNLTLLTGGLILNTAGAVFNITEGSNSKVGQVTLVAGVATVTITGLTTNSRAFPGFVAQGGTSTAIYEYKMVCTANTLTITAITIAGVTVTTDTSTLNYFIIN